MRYDREAVLGYGGYDDDDDEVLGLSAWDVFQPHKIINAGLKAAFGKNNPVSKAIDFVDEVSPGNAMIEHIAKVADKVVKGGASPAAAAKVIQPLVQAATSQAQQAFPTAGPVLGPGGAQVQYNIPAILAMQQQAMMQAQARGGQWLPPQQAFPQLYGAPPLSGGAFYGSQGTPYSGPSRRLPLPFPTTTLSDPTLTISATIRTAKPIRIERIVLQRTNSTAVAPAAGQLLVTSITLGMDNQFVSAAGGVPIEAFGPTAQSGIVLSGGWLGVGQDLVINFLRTAAAGAGAGDLITGAVYGETPEGDAWVPAGFQTLAR